MSGASDFRQLPECFSESPASFMYVKDGNTLLESYDIVSKRVQQIVIMGHTGFIGQTLYRWLNSEGLPVIGASSEECNLLDSDSVNIFFSNIPEKADVVFCSVINRHTDDSIRSLHNNIDMVENFIRCVRRKRLRSLIYLSSVDVYGRFPELPINEKTMPIPSGYYGVSKLCSEFLLKHSGGSDCPVAILRLPGVYGQGDKGKSIVGLFTDRLCSGEVIKLSGDGMVLRDYVEVGDVCRIVKDLIEKPKTTTLNLATGNSLTLKEIVRTIGETIGSEPDIRYITKDENSAGDLIFDTRALLIQFAGIQLTELKRGCASYVKAKLYL